MKSCCAGRLLWNSPLNLVEMFFLDIRENYVSQEVCKQ